MAMYGMKGGFGLVAAAAALALPITVTGMVTAVPASAGPIVFHSEPTPATPMAIPGAQIDIIGLVPGMGFPEARAIIMKQIGDDTAPVESKVELSGSHDNVAVVSEPFVNQLIVGHMTKTSNESFCADFSGPASGNRLVGVKRQIVYANGVPSPLKADIEAKLIAKYGTPSFVQRIQGSAMLQWHYEGNRLVPAHANWPISDFTPGAETYTASGISQILQASNPIRSQYLITAQISPPTPQSNLASGFTITISSGDLRMKVAQTDVKSIIDAIMKGASVATPVATPNL